MKKGCILCLLISVISLPLIAQNIIYSNLKELLAQHGDTTAVLRVEKRSRNQIVLTGGADYRITAGDDELMCRRLKKRCFAVRDEKGDLYLNCRKLRYKKLRFGASSKTTSVLSVGNCSVKSLIAFPYFFLLNAIIYARALFWGTPKFFEFRTNEDLSYW